MVLFLQDIGKSPVTKSVDVAELAFPVEDFLGPLSGHGKGFGELAEEFDNLGYVVVVFAVFSAGLRVEEIVTCDQLEDLWLLAFIQILVGRLNVHGQSTHHSSHRPDIGTCSPFRS